MRREIHASYSDACSAVNCTAGAASSARPTPSSSESRTSADATGSGTPACSSLAAALRAASRALASPAPARIVLARGSCRFCGELVRPLFGSESLGELFEVAAEGGFEVVGGDADAVVGDASLREVVCADLRRAVAGTDLRLAEGAFLLGPFAHLTFQEPGLEDPHGLLLVLELHILGLWQDGHGRRRGMYAALALGLGHPLDPVGPAFVLEDRVGAVAAYLHSDLPVATDLGRARRQGTVLEAEAVGIAGVHVV